jgi:WD40 repeat protein
MALSPNGKYIATGGGGDTDTTCSEDTEVRIWDSQTGEFINCIEGHNDVVEDLAFTVDGNALISSSRTTYISRIDRDRFGERITAEHAVRIITLSPDGKRMIGRCLDFGQMLKESFVVWDMSTGSIIHNLEVHGRINDVDLLCGRLVAIACEKEFILLDIETRKCVHKIFTHGPVTSVKFSCDGSRLIFNEIGYGLHIWDLQAKGNPTLFANESGVIGELLMLPDGKAAVSASNDGSVRIWDMKTHLCTNILRGHKVTPTNLFSTPDAALLITYAPGESIRVWDMATGECVIVQDAKLIESIAGIHGPNLYFAQDHRVQVGSIENYIPIPLVTGQRNWQFAESKDCRGKWDGALTAQCHWCGQRFAIQLSWLGQQVTCPIISCGKPLKLNPFVCDISNWLE